MEEITIKQKPDEISWDDIHNLLVEAHKKNVKKGIVLRYAQMTGDEIEKLLGKEGCCWVAMDGSKLVGTTSVTFFNGKSWWNKNKKVAHGCFTGILSNYQGIGIREDFDAKTVAYMRKMGADMIEGDTAENNKIMRKIWEKQGVKIVAYFASASNHYSVRSAYWLDGCPFSERYIKFRFNLSKYLTKLQYKEGKIERNKLLSLMCKVANSILVRV